MNPGKSFRIFARGSDFDLQFPLLHFTGMSDKNIDEKKEYIGIIVYSIGNFDAKKHTGHNIRPGWVLVRDTTEVRKVPSKDATEYGKLVKLHFNSDLEQLVKQ